MKNMEQHSLTDPMDRKNWKPSNQTLTDDELALAVDDLHLKPNYPKFDGYYNDPILPTQQYGLVSFTPSNGASPNEKGFYGWAKVRGVFMTQTEADQKAEELIRRDSYNTIYTIPVGRPFPLTLSSKYSAAVNEVDVRQDMKDSTSSYVKKVKEDEQRTVKDIKDREQALLKQGKDDSPDSPEDRYTTLQVKKAQLTWVYQESQKKMEEVKRSLIETRQKLESMDKENPTFRTSYVEKYLNARKESGFVDKPEDHHKNFLHLLGEDIDLGF